MEPSPEAGSDRSPALADEQAALRRVATLVARGAPPEEVFAAVAVEVGRVLDADLTFIERYDTEPEATVSVLGAWTRTGASAPAPVGQRVKLGGRNVSTLVFQTGRPARVDEFGEDSGPALANARAAGVRSAAGVPILIEGRLWGIMIVGSTREDPLPSGIEARLAGFTELAATAIASAQSRVELRGFAHEQAALHRVATLVARGAPPEQLFAAVAAEVARVVDADFSILSRYARDGTATVVAVSASPPAAPVGTRLDPGGRNVHTLVFQTRRPARIDDYAGTSGPAASVAHESGVRSAMGVPITVEGRLWGVMAVANVHEQSLPVSAEARLAGFTELVATAVANAQARTELRGFADEQAALRRVATLVARGARPEEVFAAVTEEAGRVMDADLVSMDRYDPDGKVTVLAARPAIITTEWSVGGRNVSTLVLQTGRPARIDDYGEASGPGAVPTWEWGVRSAVGAPITVEGRLWGVMFVASRRERALPADTEARLARFTELVATAVANAEAQAALRASRARIVAAADATRQRIERDLHDGAQQRLVSLALQLRKVRADVPPEAAELKAQLDGIATELTAVLDELREFARGIHPAILADGGLGASLKTLARRCPIPVTLDVAAGGRLPEQVEVCAYYVVSEALANAAKHSRAAAVTVQVTAADGTLTVRVRDDGTGGAGFGTGTGLIGLKDRVEARGGQFALRSEPGDGTTITAHLPLTTQSS